MKISRRNFIKIGALAGIAAGTNLIALKSAEAQKRVFTDYSTLIGPLQDPLLNITAEDFRNCVGSEFMFLTKEKTISVVLSEVTETQKSPELSKRTEPLPRVKNAAQNYVLSFQMPTDDFPQATYQIWHPAFGQFDLFLVPRKLGKPFLLYAVINRL